jgi:aromatic-L-amino-acid decarboxylase
MTPEEFRCHAHALVDWMADYLRDVESRRVMPLVSPGEIRRQLPADPPDGGEPFERLVADFERIILPGMTHWNHPGWFGYFPANHSPPSILAEMVTAALGAQCMSWQTSPAATELEQTVMVWLGGMLGLPEGLTGVIQDTASTATLVALLTARERAGGADGGTVYASEERHSSVDKAVKLSGFAPDALRLVPTDETFALRPEALHAMLAADRAAGRRPACIVATVGTTSSTAVDPLAAIAPLAAEAGAWLHVDASYAGTAAILPERRWILDGVEGADSLVVNPHKWLFTNFDCTAYYVRDVPALLATFGASPAFLRTAHDPDVANFRDWGIQLGRRFRALKLWWVIRTYGVEGLRAMLREHIALAAAFRAWVEADDRFEVPAPSPFGLVTFRLRAAPGEEPQADERSRELLAEVNRDGRVFLSGTVLGGRFTLRLAVGQLATERRHVALAWELLRRAADSIAGARGAPSRAG